ncbi:MAG: TetR/AcrR family transcriptional regulator [Stellaceae bacterium]
MRSPSARKKLSFRPRTAPRVTPRKEPRQARAQATLEAVLSAAAQVLVEEGFERATTNRIAEVAGVSVGSLYQYFPNKEAIVNALVERHEGEMFEQLAGMAATLEHAPLEEAIATYVRAMLKVHATSPKLHEVLTRQMPSLDPAKLLAMQSRVEMVVRIYLEKHRARLRPMNVELAAFLLSTSVEAVSHMAIIQRPEVLRDRAFADELTQLVLGYLLRR